MHLRQILKFLALFLIAALISAQNHVLYLDGEGDFVSLPATIISDHSFTIEAWASIEGDGGGEGQNTIFEQRDDDVEFGHSAIILNAEVPYIGEVARFAIRASSSSTLSVQGPMFPYHEWHHYAGVVSSDSIFLYLDGALVDAIANSQLGNYDESIDHIDIGRHYYYPQYVAGFFNGYIEDLRIWDGALNGSEVVDAKNAHLQNIQYALLAGWDFETEEFLDISQNGFNGVAMGDAHIVEMELLGQGMGHSLFLDGIDDYAVLPSPIIHTNEFTVELWAAMLGTGGGLDLQNTLFSQRDYNTQANRSAVLLTAENFPDESSTSFNIRSNQGVSDRVSTSAPPYGEWHHYAGVVSIDSVYLYIDGQLSSVGGNNQEGVFDYSIDHIDIGRHYHSIDYHAGYFNGYIDELKVWAVARSGEEIQNDMYTQISEIDSNLVGYFNFDDDFVKDLSENGNHGDLMNGAAIEVANLSPGGCQVFGDTNGNGSVDISDVITLVNYIVGLQVNEFNEACADLSWDGNINISDVIHLVEYILED